MRKVTKKRHAARKTRAAALSLSVLTTAGLASALAISEATPNQTTAEVAVSSTSSAVTNTPATNAPAETTTPATGTDSASTSVDETTTSAETSNAQYADGTFTGASQSTNWGPVQVSVTTSNDEIVSVNLLSVPSNDRKSERINAAAGPTLVSDSLTSQSADVDIVSGATYTSMAYEESMQSALDGAATALDNELAST